jgi:hypothetical protein
MIEYLFRECVHKIGDLNKTIRPVDLEYSGECTYQERDSTESLVVNAAFQLLQRNTMAKSIQRTSGTVISERYSQIPWMILTLTYLLELYPCIRASTIVP